VIGASLDKTDAEGGTKMVAHRRETWASHGDGWDAIARERGEGHQGRCPQMPRMGMMAWGMFLGIRWL